MKEASSYREGDSPEDVSTEEKKTDAVDEVPVEVPITAFMVIMMPDGTVECAPDVSQFMKVRRKANFKDIRNMTHSVYEDTHMALNAQEGGQMILESLAKAKTRQQIRTGVRSNIVAPGSYDFGGKRRG